MNDSGWHLDKRVPIALIATIAVQTGAGVWWASEVTNRVVVLERDMHRVQVDQQRDRDEVRQQVNGLRIWMEGRFDRLEGKLDRKVDKP